MSIEMGRTRMRRIRIPELKMIVTVKLRMIVQRDRTGI